MIHAMVALVRMCQCRRGVRIGLVALLTMLVCGCNAMMDDFKRLGDDTETLDSETATATDSSTDSASDTVSDTATDSASEAVSDTVPYSASTDDSESDEDTATDAD